MREGTRESRAQVASASAAAQFSTTDGLRAMSDTELTRMITGHSLRKFKPNIQKVRVLENDGKTAVRKKVCARCLKAGKVVKR